MGEGLRERVLYIRHFRFPLALYGRRLAEERRGLVVGIQELVLVILRLDRGIQVL